MVFLSFFLSWRKRVCVGDYCAVDIGVFCRMRRGEEGRGEERRERSTVSYGEENSFGILIR